MAIKILGDRILVLRDSSESKTNGGIYIPVQSVEKKNTGTVIMVGPGTEKFKMTVKVGDRVSFRPHAGTEVPYNDMAHLIMRDGDVDFIY